MKTAILAGATGLIGSQLLDILLKEESYDRVIALSRKPLSLTHPKLQNLILDYESIHQYSEKLKGGDVFCCLGTTMKQAGSQDAFRKVDLEYPVALARVTKDQGAQQFLIVTSMGASKTAFFFYNRVKGEVQEEIGTLGFKSLYIFQPALLVGPRTVERAGERMGSVVMNALRFLIPKKHQPIESVKVARAMVAKAKQSISGTFIYESAELQAF